MLAALVSSSQDAIISVGLDGLVTSWNPGAVRLFGFSWLEAMGRPLRVLFPPERSLEEKGMLEHAFAGVASGRCETRWLREEGDPVELSITMGPIRNSDGRLAGVAITAFDNTRSKVAEQELIKSMRYLRKGFDNAPIGMALVERDGRFVEVNDAMCSLLGYSRAELLETTFQAITLEEDLPKELAFAHQMLAGDIHSYHLEKRFIKADRDPVWVMLSCSSVNALQPLPDFLLLQMEDISHIKEAEERLLHQAMHDPLTDLPNRRLLTDRITQALARSVRTQTGVALIFLDLDGFKQINDSVGHDFGDELLTIIAERLRRILRPQDTVARLGGDEFVMLCGDLDNEFAVVPIAERIASAVSEPVTIGTDTVTTTASIGIAVADSGNDRPSKLMSNADAAMYRAKEEGGNRFEVFDQKMQLRAMQRRQLEAELRLALERDELRLVYQPQRDLETGTIHGVEALVRWEHPQRGMLSPGEFIPVAESSGLILPLGLWVMKEACEQAVRWMDPEYPVPAMKMSVNISSSQLLSPGFADEVANILDRCNLPPSELCLEIPETVLMTAPGALPACRALKALGVRIDVDDFGTGFSSLGRLKQLQVDSLKIDQSFVQSTTEEDSAIVAAVVGLAESLNLMSIAEGVETAGQAAVVRDAGCGSAQGFYFDEPQLAEDLTGMTD